VLSKRPVETQWHHGVQGSGPRFSSGGASHGSMGVRGLPQPPSPHRRAADDGVWYPDPLVPALQWEGDFAHDKLGITFNPFAGVPESLVVDHFTERIPGPPKTKETLHPGQRGRVPASIPGLSIPG